MDLLQAWSSLGHKSNPRPDQWALAACVAVVKHNVKKLQESLMFHFFNLWCCNMQTYISINNKSQQNSRVCLYDLLWLKPEHIRLRFPSEATLFSYKDKMAELSVEPHLLTDVSQRAFWNSPKHPSKQRLKLQSRINPEKKERTPFSLESTEEISSNVFFSLVAMWTKGTTNLISSSRCGSIMRNRAGGTYFGKRGSHCSTLDI